MAIDIGFEGKARTQAIRPGANAERRQRGRDYAGCANPECERLQQAMGGAGPLRRRRASVRFTRLRCRVLFCHRGIGIESRLGVLIMKVVIRGVALVDGGFALCCHATRLAARAGGEGRQGREVTKSRRRQSWGTRPKLSETLHWRVVMERS